MIQQGKLKPLLTMNALLVLGLALVTVQGSHLPEGVPVLFTTGNQILGGESTRIYHAALCGGCSFDGLTAQVQVNLVNNPWDCELGDYMIISVEDGNGSVIETNVDGRQMPVPNFNFTYSAKYKDLFLHIKTGPAPQFLFTLSLLFDFKTRVHVPAHCVPRWQMTASEHAVSQKYKQGNDTAELYQVFKILTTQEVPTEETKLFQLGYCFAKQGDYKVIITVIKENLWPGLATYGCTMSYIKQHGECGGLTPYRDMSGLPVNVVQIDIKESADYGPVQVLVLGEGRYGQSNGFIIVARLLHLH